MFKKFFCVLFVILFIFCSSSCGKTENNSTKSIVTWQMSAEAKAYFDYYQTKNDNEYFKPGEMFNSWLASRLTREKESQTIDESIIAGLTNKPVVTKCKDESVYTMSKEGYDKIVLYLHGGAYMEEAVGIHATFCDELVDKLNAKVCLPLYPLTPQYTWQKAYEMLDELYKELLNENKPIYIMGDSAGGGLTLAFTEYLIANDIKAPNKIVMFSPWIDITTSNPDISEYEKKDRTLAVYGTQVIGKLWAGDTDTLDYRLSPIYGNLSNLPDILLFVSDNEIMYPDAMKLYNSITNSDIQIVVGEGFFHVFPIYEIPERQQALSLINNFCD